MMMRNNIHKIIFFCSLLALAACSDKDVEPTPSGEGKTPLMVTALLDVNNKASQTRAVDKQFDENDKLLAYIRHVTWDGKTNGTRTSVTADKAPVLVTFTKGSENMETYSGEDITPIGLASKENENDRSLHLSNTNTQQTSDLTNNLGVGGGHIYWDDFSDASSKTTDLHTAGHYLQSYYGYCYNGGTPTALVEATGVIGWTILKDQSGTTVPTNFQKSDLLWSAEQTPVAYDHAANRKDNTRAGIVLPYTHAMSKVTINVIAGEGFAYDYEFQNADGTKKTGVTLDMVRTTCTATAPTATLTYPTDGSGKANVTMKKGTVATTNDKPSCPFQAIIVPSVLTVGNKLASITDMDGNEYFIYVTNNIIDGWKKQLEDTDEDIHEGTAQASPRTRADEPKVPGGKGHQMKSGVHYILNVTVNKTEVTVSATILDWNEITAEGKGEIFFVHDVKDDGTIDEALKDHGFDVYKSTSTTFGTKATSLRWNRTSGKWKYNPTIYWLGGQNEYFRALSNVKTDATGTPVNESLTMENGRDALWGTTPAHSGEYEDKSTYSYDEGAALAPRTGKVPLLFYHAMSKITINLEDIGKNASDPKARLDLSGATIQLTNLATGGTIELDKGVITPSTKEDKVFSEDRGAIPSRMGFFAASENGTQTNYNSNVTVRDYFIIPQEIGNESLLIVTLANGTTYKTKLNTCQVQNTNEPVKKWERNKHYIYDITLAKDQILFRAEIKNWDKVNVNGIITPEW